jgi:hypothetical protein
VVPLVTQPTRRHAQPLGTQRPQHTSSNARHRTTAEDTLLAHALCCLRISKRRTQQQVQNARRITRLVPVCCCRVRRQHKIAARGHAPTAEPRSGARTKLCAPCARTPAAAVRASAPHHSPGGCRHVPITGGCAISSLLQAPGICVRTDTPAVVAPSWLKPHRAGFPPQNEECTRPAISNFVRPLPDTFRCLCVHLHGYKMIMRPVQIGPKRSALALDSQSLYGDTKGSRPRAPSTGTGSLRKKALGVFYEEIRARSRPTFSRTSPNAGGYPAGSLGVGAGVAQGSGGQHGH